MLEKIKTNFEVLAIGLAIGLALGGAWSAIEFKKIGFNAGLKQGEINLINQSKFYLRGTLVVFCAATKEMEENFNKDNPEAMKNLRRFN